MTPNSVVLMALAHDTLFGLQPDLLSNIFQYRPVGIIQLSNYPNARTPKTIITQDVPDVPDAGPSSGKKNYFVTTVQDEDVLKKLGSILYGRVAVLALAVTVFKP